jgi:hypothetical protein
MAFLPRAAFYRRRSKIAGPKAGSSTRTQNNRRWRFTRFDADMETGVGDVAQLAVPSRDD